MHLRLSIVPYLPVHWQRSIGEGRGIGEEGESRGGGGERLRRGQDQEVFGLRLFLDRNGFLRTE